MDELNNPAARSNSATVSVAALGCKLSQSEGEEIARRMVAAGFLLLPLGEAVDVAVVHTCTVTGKADRKSRNFLGRARRSASLVIAAGCGAVLDGAAILSAGLADLVVGHEQEADIPALVMEKLGIEPQPSSEITAAVDYSSEFEEAEQAGEWGHTRAFLPIQTGCDRACSYCRVRLARGPSRSLSFAEVERLIDERTGHGYREIVLAGVDLVDWREGSRDFPDLLATVLHDLPPDVRIRLSSLEPDADRLLRIAELMHAHPRSLARHLHLPLQSASDRVLSSMGRAYVAADYFALISRLNELVPDICLGADVLLGFPGEEESDYAVTHDMIANSSLAYLHCFPYSIRPGTPAASLSAVIHPEIAARRMWEMRELSAAKWESFRTAQLGKCAEVLVEKKPDRESGAMGGLSSNYIRVWASGLEGCQNSWIKVRLIRLEGRGIWGQALPDK